MSPPEAFGRYRVVAELGRGAMGVVYRGLDPSLDRTVAIKAIAARQAGSSLQAQELEARFLREAKLSARILHPGVVTVFDSGREGDNLYLVMELVEGESLADRIARSQYPSAPESLELVAHVADALGAAHQLGVVHRDVKPANILLTRDGRVKVSDFGVAKAVGEGTDLTRTGMVVGSPAYMAPEQVRGEVIDGRADLFSLGVILYELLVRRRPFPAETLTTLIFQILHDDPFADEAAFSTLGPDVAAFLRSCLAKNVRDRIPDAATFAARTRALAASLKQPPPLPAVPPVAATAPVAAPPAAVARTTATSPIRAAVEEKKTAPFVVAQVAPKPAPKPSRHLAAVALLGIGLLVVATLIVVLRRPQAPIGETVSLEPTPVYFPTATARVETLVVATVAAPATPAPTVPVWEPPPTVPPPPPRTPAVHVGLTEDLRPLPTRPGELRTVETRVVEIHPVPTATPPIEKVFVCSKGAKFNVSPEEAVVTINGKTIGIADDWDNMGGGKTFMFTSPGLYYVRLTLDGYKTAWVKIVVEAGAKDEIADVDTELQQN